MSRARVGTTVLHPPSLSFLLLLVLINTVFPMPALRVIQAHFTAVAPRIDGDLENLWQKGDSASEFIQQSPDAGSPATEPTTVYLLFNQDYLFVAFRCLVPDMTRVSDRLNAASDGVQLFIDTFNDKTTCYAFYVGFNGLENTYRVTADGADVENWSGGWWSEVKRHPWGFVIEIAIPFRSLRFKPGVEEWGIDFARYCRAKGECSFWTSQERTGFKVSRMGRLQGIKPGRQGFHLELYPVGLIRQEKTLSGNATWADNFSASAGFDGAYYPTPSASFRLTALPDFAQIEADPYQVNLSRYELWLSERRPFFTEAMETFGGSTQPIKMFYSRRIGKPLPGGAVVPIWGGIKYTDRFARGQLGGLVAVTGSCEDEPTSIYTVFSARQQVLNNSELGLLYAGKDNPVFSNHGCGFDAILRQNSLSTRVFLAGSQLGESLDYALSAEGSYNTTTYQGAFIFRQIQPRFNMNGPGYTTWRGRYFTVYAGPSFYNWRFLQSALITPGIELQHEWDIPLTNPTWQAYLNAHTRFQTGQFVLLWSSFGRTRDWDRWYWTARIGGYISSDYTETRPLSATLILDYTSKTANYRRGIIAPGLDGALNIAIRPIDRWTVELNNSMVVEPDSTGRINPSRDLTFILRPGVTYAFSAKSSLRLVSEIVNTDDPDTATPRTTFSLFGLYSYQFRPRSHLYFAVNWFNSSSNQAKLVQVVKIRYLYNI